LPPSSWGKSDLQIVGNMQQRKQALSAAQQTIEQVISSTQFTATPTTAVFNPCKRHAELGVCRREWRRV